MIDRYITLKKLLDILFQNIKGVVVIFIFFITITSLYLTFSPKLYDSRTMLQVENFGNKSSAGFETLGLESNASDLDQQEKIYLSRLVLLQVKENIGLEENVESIKSRIIRVQELDNRVFGVKRGGLLEFSIIDSDPDLSEKILAEANKIFIQESIRKYSEEARKSINFLDQNIERVRNALSASSNRLNAFKEGSIPYDISLEAQTKLAALTKLEEEIAALNADEKEISKTYKTNHPIYRTLIEQKDLLLNRKNDLTSQINQLPSTERDYIELARDVEINESTLQSMLNRKLELSVIEASTTGNIRVIDSPYTFNSSVYPRPVRTIAVNILLAGLIALLYIFINYYFFRKVMSPQDLELFENTPVLGVIPNDGDSSHSFNEAFKSLMVNMLMHNKDTKTILITGPTAKVGKSFVSLRFAQTLAEAGKKVLLLDLDLRRGDLHEDLKIDRKLGFKMGDIPEPISVSKNLDFIPRGSGIKSEFNLLNSIELRNFIRDSREKYDHIVIDTPPILSVSDYAILSTDADFKIMVSRQSLTRLTEIKFAVDEVMKTSNKIDGLVLNDFTSSIAYYGYDYYSYKYRGAYDYEDE